MGQAIKKLELKEIVNEIAYFDVDIVNKSLFRTSEKTKSMFAQNHFFNGKIFRTIIYFSGTGKEVEDSSLKTAILGSLNQLGFNNELEYSR